MTFCCFFKGNSNVIDSGRKSKNIFCLHIKIRFVELIVSLAFNHQAQCFSTFFWENFELFPQHLVERNCFDPSNLHDRAQSCIKPRTLLLLQTCATCNHQILHDMTQFHQATFIEIEKPKESRILCASCHLLTPLISNSTSAHKHRKKKNVSLNNLIASSMTTKKKRMLRQMRLEIVVDVITRFLALTCEFLPTFHHVMQWRRSHFIIHQLSWHSSMNFSLRLQSQTTTFKFLRVSQIAQI